MDLGLCRQTPRLLDGVPSVLELGTAGFYAKNGAKQNLIHDIARKRNLR